MSFPCFFIRTLYCAKGNYEFGISRIMKSLEPYNKKVYYYFTKVLICRCTQGIVVVAVIIIIIIIIIILVLSGVKFSCVSFSQLGTDTWFYAKRCFLSLLENLVRKLVLLYVESAGFRCFNTKEVSQELSISSWLCTFFISCLFCFFTGQTYDHVTG